MKTWGYTQISSSRYGVRVSCSEGSALMPLVSELKKRIPSLEVVGEIVPGLCLVQLKNFEGHEARIGLWLVEMLGKNGWEPFSVETLGGDSVYHLRHESGKVPG